MEKFFFGLFLEKKRKKKILWAIFQENMREKNEKNFFLGILLRVKEGIYFLRTNFREKTGNNFFLGSFSRKLEKKNSSGMFLERKREKSLFRAIFSQNMRRRIIFSKIDKNGDLWN